MDTRLVQQIQSTLTDLGNKVKQLTNQLVHESRENDALRKTLTSTKVKLRAAEQRIVDLESELRRRS